MIIMTTEMKVVLSQSIKLFSSCFQVVFKLFSSCFQVVFKLFSSDETTDEVRTSTYVRLFIGCLVGWSNVILTCL